MSERSRISKGTLPKGKRLLWFVAFYALSLVTFTGLVYLLRFIVKG